MEKGKNLDGVRKATQFSKENQPSPEAKANGKKRKRELKQLANALISDSAIDDARTLAEKVGIDLQDDEYTLEVIMTLRQIDKALNEGDTRAYIAAMDRIAGKPTQTIEAKVDNEPKRGEHFEGYELLEALREKKKLEEMN